MKNNKYQSPAFWEPKDIDINDIPGFFREAEDPDGPNQWLVTECSRRNAIRRNECLGEKTGWPSKWRDAIETEPTGDEWHAAFVQAATTIESNGILILSGKRGPGKTRMAAELALYQKNSRYRTAMRFFLEIRESFRKDSAVSELETIKSLTRTELLVLDELQERGDTAFEDRLLTHLIDARYAENKPTILIANLTRKELTASLGASIVSRIHENGDIIECGWASFRGGKL